MTFWTFLILTYPVLGEDVESEKKDRQRRGDEARCRRRVSVLQVLDGGERARHLRELSHAPADDGEVQNAAADVAGGKPK